MKAKRLVIIALLVVFVVALAALCGCEFITGLLEKPTDLAIEVAGDECLVLGPGMSRVDQDIIIPDTYKGKPVTSIVDEAFKGCKITSITIGNNIEKIGESAFENSTIKTITFKQGCKLTTIAKYAFRNCKSLQEITLPSQVTEIGERAFSGCDALKYLNLNEGLEEIGIWAFASCYRLLEVTIPSTLERLDLTVFSECYALREVCNNTDYDIDHNISATWIYSPRYEQQSYLSKEGDFVFFEYYSVPRLVRYDGTDSDVTLPDSYKGGKYILSSYAFYNDDNLTNVRIPDTIDAIENHVFDHCVNLQSITLPSNLTAIGEEAFAYCASLQTVTVPQSVTKFGNNVFTYCEALTTVNWNAVNYPDNGGLFSNCSNITTVNIGDEVETIGESALTELPKLRTINIGKSLKKLGYYAFHSCKNLTTINVSADNPNFHSAGGCLIETETKTLVLGCKEVKIPTDGSVTKIGLASFYGGAVSSVIVPPSVTVIDKSAFSECESLSNVEIQGHLTSLGYSAFYGCGKLTEISYAGTTQEFSSLLVNDSFQHPTSIKKIVCSNGELTIRP